MITENWKPLLKFDHIDHTEGPSNLVYTPLVDPENTIMCMDFVNDYNYWFHDRLPKPLTDRLYNTELSYLSKLQKYDWAPKLLEVEEGRIFIEFSKPTINGIMYDIKVQQKPPEDAVEQIFNICNDLKNEGIYKLSLYPHSFYVTGNKIKTIDFYSCIDMDDCVLPLSEIEPIIGGNSQHRFTEASNEHTIDFSVFFKQYMLEHSHNYWVVGNPMPDIYKKLY